MRAQVAEKLSDARVAELRATRKSEMLEDAIKHSEQVSRDNEAQIEHLQKQVATLEGRLLLEKTNGFPRNYVRST